MLDVALYCDVLTRLYHDVSSVIMVLLMMIMMMSSSE